MVSSKAILSEQTQIKVCRCRRIRTIHFVYKKANALLAFDSAELDVTNKLSRKIKELYMCKIHSITEKNRAKTVAVLSENWGSDIIVSRGRAHSVKDLSGYVAVDNGDIKGIVTYHMDNSECEIITLDSLEKNCGIGYRLIKTVTTSAIKAKCKRVWLITTNDNYPAIGYYQRKGFTMVDFYKNSIAAYRKIKPQIPIVGVEDIPILHEIEFEIKLN